MAESEVEDKVKTEESKAEENKAVENKPEETKKQDDKKTANQNKKDDESNEKEEESFQVKQKRDKIKQAAKDFWGPTGAGFGATHEVSEWGTDEKGQILLSHFATEGKDAVLYNDCLEYRECLSKYQKAKGDASYDYDESCVDFNRLQTDYDVAFYVVLSGFPKFLISSTNQHTMGFVMTRFKEGNSVGSIVKEARTKLSQQTANNSKDGKETKKEDKENEEDKEAQEQKTDEQTQEPKTQEQAMQEKKEQDAWAVVVMKDKAMKEIQDKVNTGYYGNDIKDLYDKLTEKYTSPEGVVDMDHLMKEFNKNLSQMLRDREITLNIKEDISKKYSSNENAGKKNDAKTNPNIDNDLDYSEYFQNAGLGDQ